MAAQGRGKPCGASHIAASKVCRVSLGPEVNRALGAATGEVGAATLWHGVKQYAGPKGIKRLVEIRNEIRREMGGNIVKGPKADALKKRLQDEGLLPPKGKSKSLDAGQLFQQQLQQRAPSVPPELKAQLNALGGQVKTPTAKPNSKYGPWGDSQLRGKLNAAKKLGEKEMAQRIENELKRRGAPLEKVKSVYDGPKGLEKFELETQKHLDADVEANTTARAGKSGYDWKNSLQKDAKVLGAGAYGTAILGSNGDVVKRGEIGRNEAAIIERVGKLGLGPKLVSAELDGPGFMGVDTSRGRLAMSKVEGEPIGWREGKDISNAYWEARANLHRAGIAHNDMHIDNVMVDDKGKGRFVDMGLAQDNPKAALAEAFGVFTVPLNGTRKGKKVSGAGGDGDWQGRRYENIGGKGLTALEKSGKDTDRERLEKNHPNAARVYDNKKNAIKRMRAMGLTDQEITDIMFHGIRSKDSSFESGAMGKLTNDQAQEIIQELYNGI